MTKKKSGRQNRPAQRAAVEFSEAILGTLREGILVLDPEFRVVKANQSFYQNFQVTPDQTEGRSLFDLGNGQWNMPRLRQLLDDVLDAERGIDSFEVEHEFETIGRRVMLLNARRIEHLQLILLAIEDVTEKLDQERSLRQREEQLRKLNESLEQQVELRTEILSILQDVTRVANEARTVSEAVRAAMRRIGEYNGWRIGHLWQLDGEGDRRMISTGLWHLTEDGQDMYDEFNAFRHICQSTRYSPGEGLIGKVWSTGDSHWVDDVAQFDDWIRDGASSLDIHAAIAFPVFVHGDVVAVMEFFSDRPTAREDRFMQIMPDVGMQLGHLIERKRLERQIADTIEREQRRLGGDIHDGVGQELTGLRYLAQSSADSLLEQGSTDAPTVQQIADGLASIHKQLRAIVRDLVPVELSEEGLESALRALADRTSASRHVRCVLECRSPVTIGTESHANHVYRIVQEAVNNAVQHAQPRRIEIRISSDRRELNVEVMDDGISIPTDGHSTADMGIHTMKYRADLIGAELSIAARPEGGTVVRCRLPLRHRSSS